MSEGKEKKVEEREGRRGWKGVYECLPGFKSRIS